MPPGTTQVVAVGHQFWWEFRYPDHRFVTANELHVPVSDPKRPTPTHITLMSADVDHSFWVPKLAGKTDLIPNRVNNMWIDPHETSVFVGQCAQYCGTQHAKMLLRVVVQSHEDFDKWVSNEQHPAAGADSEAQGRRVFESTACVNCHTISGTYARGTFGPDLTHLMSRVTRSLANPRRQPIIADGNWLTQACATIATSPLPHKNSVLLIGSLRLSRRGRYRYSRRATRTQLCANEEGGRFTHRCAPA
jgi:hypothetical protein